MAKISQRQVLARLINADGIGPDFGNTPFAQVSGGEITASVEKVYDGGQLFPEVLCAPLEVGDVTVTRHYDPERDGPALRAIRTLVGRTYYNIQVDDYDCDLRVPGTARVYSRALLVSLTEPEGDSSSGAPAVFSLTFSIASVSGITG